MTHSTATSEKDRDIIIQELLTASVFSVEEAGKKDNTFPRPRNLLHLKNKEAILSWIVNMRPGHCIVRPFT